MSKLFTTIVNLVTNHPAVAPQASAMDPRLVEATRRNALVRHQMRLDG